MATEEKKEQKLAEPASVTKYQQIAKNISPSLTTKSAEKQTATKNQVTNATTGWNRDLMVDDVAYDLYIPPNYEDDPLLPAILVLPGWNFPRTSWVKNSDLVKYAQEYGYALILPEMGKTLYESQYYPETTMKWNSIPGGEFIKQRFIPGIQARHQLLLAGKYNTMLGLSTGGRGVALIALENPGLFLAAASLSGDFSQENMPQDRLMTSIYGSFNSFAPRWQGRDNPQARVTEWSVPLYLAHGTADNIVPESQTAMFCQKLKAYHGHKILIQCDRIAGAGHDYKFWGGILPSVFQFFQQQKLIMNRAIR